MHSNLSFCNHTSAKLLWKYIKAQVAHGSTLLWLWQANEWDGALLLRILLALNGPAFTVHLHK